MFGDKNEMIEIQPFYISYKLSYYSGDQLLLEKGYFWKVKKLEGHICRAYSRARKKGGSGVRKLSINGVQMVQNLGISGKFDPFSHL